METTLKLKGTATEMDKLNEFNVRYYTKNPDNTYLVTVRHAEPLKQVKTIKALYLALLAESVIIHTKETHKE